MDTRLRKARSQARPNWCSNSDENRLVLDSPRLGNFSSSGLAELVTNSSNDKIIGKLDRRAGAAIPVKSGTGWNH